ncbi:MAG: hypothetical protein ACI9SG_002450, partial [Maribacter sp.]
MLALPKIVLAQGSVPNVKIENSKAFEKWKST